MRITFELSKDDLEHFRAVMRNVNENTTGLSDQEIIEPARKTMQAVDDGADIPDFIGDRLKSLATMIAMLEDQGWGLPEMERQRVLSALAYFADPEDIIPDHIPGLGFLDDAIMIELATQELRHEIEAYEDFCRYREAEASRRKLPVDEELDRAEWLVARRLQLQTRMRRRRRSARTRRTSSFSLWR